MIENSKPEGHILKTDIVKMYLVAVIAGLFFFSFSGFCIVSMKTNYHFF